MSVLKFLAGLLSNTLIQSVRCLWNAASFLALFAVFILCAATAALQFAGGGTERSRIAFRKALSSLKMSLKCCAVSAVQCVGVLTCASPLMRGAQALSEGITPRGVFLPCGRNKTPMQMILGLNSWEEPSEAPPPREMKMVGAAKARRPIKERAKPTRRPEAADKKADAWEQVANRYLEARTLEDLDRIRNEMAVSHTARYLNALAAANKARPRRAA
jgi:hypothetical protein